MITEACPQFPSAMIRVVNRNYLVAKPKKASRNETLAYAVVGSMLGMVFGVSLAATSGGGVNAAGPEPSVAFNSSVSTSNVDTTAVAHPTETLQVQETKYITVTPASPSSPVVRALATHNASQAGAQPIQHKVPARKLSFASLEVPAAPAAYVSKATPAVVALNPVNEAASGGDAAAHMSFMIEGDATVADYDASARTIETRDGRSFIVDGAAGNSNVLQWVDYMGNLHYKCDQQGNCTLFRAGIAANARLTT